MVNRRHNDSNSYRSDSCTSDDRHMLDTLIKVLLDEEWTFWLVMVSCYALVIVAIGVLND